MMKFGAAGPEEWLECCLGAISGRGKLVSDGEIDALLLAGPSADVLHVADAEVKKGTPLFIRDLSEWTLVELLHIQALADESSTLAIGFHPWRTGMTNDLRPARLIHIDVPLTEPVRWNAWLRQAVDLSLFAADSHNILRVDAKRTIDPNGLINFLLCTLRFQNGSMSHISLRSSSEKEVLIDLPGTQLRTSPEPDQRIVIQAIHDFIDHKEGLPRLSEAIASRKIEEKIFSVLRTK